MLYVGEQGNVIKDGNTITEKEKSKMVAVEKLPVPETIEGKVASIRANLETQEVYYVYEDYIPTPEEVQQERIESLEQSIAELEQENLNIMLAAAETYETMYTENTNLMLAIAEVYELMLGGVE